MYHPIRTMKLVIQIKLLEAPPELLDLMTHMNAASTHAARVALETKTYSHFTLRNAVYADLKTTYGLGSGAADLSALRATKTYSDKRRRGQVVRFRPKAAVTLDRRLFSYKKGSVVSIWTRSGRIKVPFHCHQDVVLSSMTEAKLVLKNGVFYLHQAVEVPEAPQFEASDWLGVDLGIKNVAVTSDGDCYTGAHLNSLRKRKARLRGKLQSKGTKSAKRLLRKLSGKEKRFTSHVNHVISKRVVQKAKDTQRGVALEDLKGIRERLGRTKTNPSNAPKSITVSRPARTALNRWAFSQLRLYVEYKALRNGVPVRVVCPKYTSQRCSQCGYVAKKNRKTQEHFECGRCGYAANADHNAARNISYVARWGERLHPDAGVA